MQDLIDVNAGVKVERGLPDYLNCSQHHVNYAYDAVDRANVRLSMPIPEKDLRFLQTRLIQMIEQPYDLLFEITAIDLRLKSQETI